MPNTDPALSQLSVTTDSSDSERIETILLEAGAISVTLEPAAEKPVLEPRPGKTPLWERTKVAGLFYSDRDLQDVRIMLAAALGPGTTSSVQSVPRRNWVRAWMDDFGPMRFGNRLWICPSGGSVKQDDAVIVSLDPGMAFGTGTHPTTALCLEWLDAHPLAALDVIDYGCGCGVLSLAACRLGAATVTALDIDEQALLATRDNAFRNAIDADRLATGHPEIARTGSSDLLLANILSEPLIELRQTFASLLRPGGCVVMSGILREQTPKVAAAYRSVFTLREPVSKDDWVLIEGRLKD